MINAHNMIKNVYVQRFISICLIDKITINACKECIYKHGSINVKW